MRIAILIATFVCLPAAAEMYKYVDERGRVTYSNKPMPGAKKIELPEISTVPAIKPPPRPSTAPAPDDKAARREELQKKIAEAEKALEQAKQAYKEGEETPNVFRRKDGTIGRNYAAYQEKMDRLRAEVDARERELAQLKAELAALDSAPSLGERPAGKPGETLR